MRKKSKNLKRKLNRQMRKKLKNKKLSNPKKLT